MRGLTMPQRRDLQTRAFAVVVLAAAWTCGVEPSFKLLPVAEAATSSQIRDRILTRIERGRFMRAPSITAAKTATGGGPGYESVLVGGQVRLFVRYTPNKVLLSGKPAPVVFALHAAGARADATGNALGLNKLADAEGFIAVYPQAASKDWAAANASETDDVDFLNRLADALVAQNVADPKRIYLAGVGAGGSMALRIACSEGSRFAAYGIIGASPRAAADCKPSPARISIISGTSVDETLSPKNGSIAALAKPADPKSPADPIAGLAQKFGCGTLLQTTQVGKLTKAIWSGCGDGAEIEVLRSIDRLSVDRAFPELWAFFRRFGG